MPIEFMISPELDLTYAKWSGRIDIHEFQQEHARYLRDENYSAGRSVLNDFSGITEFDAAFAQVWSALAAVKRAEHAQMGKKQTIIFAPGDTEFGIARMYQSLAEYDGCAKVFVCRAEVNALKALKINYRSIEELVGTGPFKPPQPK